MAASINNQHLLPTRPE